MLRDWRQNGRKNWRDHQNWWASVLFRYLHCIYPTYPQVKWIDCLLWNLMKRSKFWSCWPVCTVWVLVSSSFSLMFIIIPSGTLLLFAHKGVGPKSAKKVRVIFWLFLFSVLVCSSDVWSRPSYSRWPQEKP
jgi:hypothetical protein